MTGAMWRAVLEEAGAKAGEGGELTMGERRLTLYVARSGATLTIGRIEAVREHEGIVRARNDKGERHFVDLADVFAMSVDGAPAGGGSARKAGFLG